MTAVLSRRIQDDYDAAEEWAYQQAYECGWCNEMGTHDECEEQIDQRTCKNPECPEFDTCFVDYSKGEPCERCGFPLGVQP